MGESLMRELLKTKLHVPKPVPGAIRRPRLLALLDEGLRSGRPFGMHLFLWGWVLVLSFSCFGRYSLTGII